jgi:hypothetical protein
MPLSLHQSFTVRPLLLHALTRSAHSASLFWFYNNFFNLEMLKNARKRKTTEQILFGGFGRGTRT